MKKVLLFVSTLALLVTLTFSTTHLEKHKRAIDEEPPPASTSTTLTN